MKTENKAASEMSVAELEALLAQKKETETEEQKKKRAEYEAQRNRNVNVLSKNAIEVSELIVGFHKDAHDLLASMKHKLEEYGGIRANSKGGFTLYSDDKKFKIVYQYKSVSGYDERADKAEALLKDFLNDIIKKKDKGMHEIIMSLLERNGQGQLEYSRVQSLYKYENNYTDARWKEAIKLFKESFMVKGSKMNIYFHLLNEAGTYDPIPLNFSSL